MVFNPFKKKDDFVDLSEHFRKKQALVDLRAKEKLTEDADLKKSFYPGVGFTKTEEPKEEPVFGMFNPAPAENTPSESSLIGTSQDNAGDKRRKLAKRLMDMTTKMEDMTNQIYSLQQRIEVLERKQGVGY